MVLPACLVPLLPGDEDSLVPAHWSGVDGPRTGSAGCYEVNGTASFRRFCVSQVHPNGVSVIFLSYSASRSRFNEEKILSLKRFKTKEGLSAFLTI